MRGRRSPTRRTAVSATLDKSRNTRMLLNMDSVISSSSSMGRRARENNTTNNNNNINKNKNNSTSVSCIRMEEESEALLSCRAVTRNERECLSGGSFGGGGGGRMGLFITIIVSIIALQVLLPVTSVSGELVYNGRTIRSSVVRPTRVTYGDIEKANKTCSPKDTCAPSRNDRNGAMMNDWKRRNCFCDQQCIVYEDCCVDSPFRRDPNVTYKKNDIFQCVTLRQFGSLYMKTKCPATWQDETIRKGCEDVKNSTFDPISSLPVTNMRSGFTYRNYFCAICNNQSFNDRIEMWKPRLECPSLTSKDNQKFTKGTIDEHLIYRPDEGNWGLMVTRGENTFWSACRVDPVVPETVEYLVRFCKPSIKDCPEGYNNTDIHRKCLSYTGTVYHLTEGYRNVHCAICNGILPENLMCDQHGYLRKAFQYEFDQAAFSLLFDLNPDTGLDVGKIRKCGREEIFDPFFQKCRAILCHPGQFYKDGQCVTSSVSTSTDVNTNDLGDGSDLNADQSNVHLLHHSKNTNKTNNSLGNNRERFETCPKIILDSVEYQVLKNGTVYINAYDKVLSKLEYAVQTSDRLVVCAPEATYYVDKFGPVLGYLSFTGVLISVICIIAHLVASCLVPELRNLSGKNLASLCIALLVIYSMFLAMPFVKIPSSSCTVMAVILYYSFMAAFCWMLILAWDVSMTLRKATQELRVSSGSQWTRFFFYSAFGWLFPALLVTVAVIAEFLPSDFMPWAYSPNFGKLHCWFGQKPALLIYFAGPVGFILLLNIILFIDSARLIASTTMGTAKAKACGPSHKNFKLYLRLALLMGISWILGIVAGYVDTPALWIVFIIFNTLQGLFIFIAFTCTAKVRKVLRAKLCCSSTSANASWTWSGIGGHHMGRTTSSSSANTKRSDLDGKDSSESHLSLPSSHHHQLQHPHHHHSHHAQQRLNHHLHHHGPSSLHTHSSHMGMGITNGSASLGSIGGIPHEKMASGKMYRSPSAELYQT